MHISAEGVKFCFYTEYVLKRHRDHKINSSSDDEKIGFILVLFKAILQCLRCNKDQRRISNLLLSIKFTRSLPPKIYRKCETNLIFGVILLCFFKYCFASRGKV